MVVVVVLRRRRGINLFLFLCCSIFSLRDCGLFVVGMSKFILKGLAVVDVVVVLDCKLTTSLSEAAVEVGVSVTGLVSSAGLWVVNTRFLRRCKKASLVRLRANPVLAFGFLVISPRLTPASSRRSDSSGNLLESCTVKRRGLAVVELRRLACRS